jgi:hypothetical protein
MVVQYTFEKVEEMPEEVWLDHSLPILVYPS